MNGCGCVIIKLWPWLLILGIEEDHRQRDYNCVKLNIHGVKLSEIFLLLLTLDGFILANYFYQETIISKGLSATCQALYAWY